jgi:hypothetical protein
MPKKYFLQSEISGYQSKPDKTNAPSDILVSPSQNVLINEKGNIQIRNGYTLFGAANTALTEIESSFDWETSSDVERNLRSYDDELEVYIGTVDSIAFNAWTKLKDSWTTVDFVFATWWSSTEKIDELLFVNGDSNIYEWSGGITTLKSRTANTLTKNGTTTWAQERFLTAGTRKVVINGTEYTYTGGESTDTLTGVTPDPSGEALNSLVMQAVRTNSNQPAANLTNDLIKVLNNQVYIGSNKSRNVYVSKNTSFIDYTFSSPRAVGEGGLLTLDSSPKGFAVQTDKMWISSGKSDWYKVWFETIELSGGSVVETIGVKKLKTGSNMGAQSQDLIAELGDYVAFISFEPALRILGDIENLENPEIKTMSDPIKTDFDAEDFTGGQIKRHKNRIYISAPVNEKVYILEEKAGFDSSGDPTTIRFWQPPQTFPIGKLSVINDYLYGHSKDIPETYKLFDGTNDNEKSFLAEASYSYRNYGDRANHKSFDEWFTEGYISANTIIDVLVNYDYEGATQTFEKEIKGDDDTILFQPILSGSLGDNPIGDSPIGDYPDAVSLLPKFRIIHEFPKSDFFEVQIIFSTDTKDAQWEIIGHGGNILLSKNQPTFIKQ